MGLIDVLLDPYSEYGSGSFFGWSQSRLQISAQAEQI